MRQSVKGQYCIEERFRTQGVTTQDGWVGTRGIAVGKTIEHWNVVPFLGDWCSVLCDRLILIKVFSLHVQELLIMNKTGQIIHLTATFNRTRPRSTLYPLPSN